MPADKAANNLVVVLRLYYINTLKQALSGTKAYKETSEEEKSVVNGNCSHLALKFSVHVKERQDRLPTIYWLPKLHKDRIKHDLWQPQFLALQLVRYKRIGYNINIMRQSACLVFNPITVNNFASLFNCTPVGRASDSMMAPT